MILLLAPLAFAGREVPISYDLLQELRTDRPSVVGTQMLRRHFGAGEMGPLIVLAHRPAGGLDQPQARPAIRDDAGPGTWRRLSSGLANHGPRKLDTLWLVFDGREPAEYRLKLDNVVVRRADGSTVPIYVDGEPTGKVPADTTGYSDVRFRATPKSAAAAAAAPQQRPRPNVLLVFADPDCGPCHALMPRVADWQRSLADRLTVAVVGRGDREDNLVVQVT